MLAPTLRARRRHRIDILVLTHAHPDHYGWLASVVQQVDVGEFWYDGEQASASEAPAAAASLPRLVRLLRQRGARLRTSAEPCAAGGRIDDAVLLLHPCPARGLSGSPFDAASDDLSGADGAERPDGAERAPSVNDASLVLRIRHGRWRESSEPRASRAAPPRPTRLLGCTYSSEPGPVVLRSVPSDAPACEAAWQPRVSVLRDALTEDGSSVIVTIADQTHAPSRRARGVSCTRVIGA